MNMGRIRQSISAQGQNVRTLFDSGARNIREVAAQLATINVPRPTFTRLGGETKISRRAALLVGEIEGKPFHMEAMVVGNDFA